MRYLRWVGLVFSLLIVGVVGGLTVPLPSEAALVDPPPTTTLKLAIDPVDGNNTLRYYNIIGKKDTSLSASIPAPNNVSGCTPDEFNAGYNQCYTIVTGTTQYDAAANAAGIVRKFMVQVAPNMTARMLVADKTGQDLFTLKGLQFVPVVGDGSTAAKTGWGSTDANTNEMHVLKAIMRNTFDFRPGVVGPYIFALHIGGYFIGGPIVTGNTFTPYANFLGLDGVGTFKPAGFTGGGPLPILGNSPPVVPIVDTTNLTPLSFQAGNPISPVASYSLSQVPAYPSFQCNNKVAGNNQCTPDITVTQTLTMYGPDTWVLTDGWKNVGGPCRLGFDEMDDDDRRISDADDMRTCKRRTNHVTRQICLETGCVTPRGVVIIGLEPPRNAEAGAVMATVACDAPGTVPPVNPCPCAGATCGTGTIVINKTTASLTEDDHQIGQFPIPKDIRTFSFTGTGLHLVNDKFDIVTDDQDDGFTGTGSRTFSGLGGTGFTGPWTISETAFPTGNPDQDGDSDSYWFTRDVSCKSKNNVPPTDRTGGPTKWDLPVPGQMDITGGLQFGHVTVTVLAPGDTLTCTFENGIFEIEPD